MIFRGIPWGAELGRLARFGNPWHGPVEGGMLTTTQGGVERPWPVQPDSGDAFLFDAGMPPVSTPENQTSVGMAWRNVATLSGWIGRSVNGSHLSGGAKAWLMRDGAMTYSARAYFSWVFDGGQRHLGGSIRLSPRVRNAAASLIDLPLVPLLLPDQARDTVDIIAISPDGQDIMLGLWDTSGVVSYTSRALADVVYSSKAYKVPPQTILRLSITASGASLSVFKVFSDVLTSDTQYSSNAGPYIYYATSNAIVSEEWSGPETNDHLCNLTHQAHTIAFLSSCDGWRGACGDNPLYDVIVRSSYSIDDLKLGTLLAGVGFKPSGQPYGVDLIWKDHSIESRTASGVGAGTYGWSAGYIYDEGEEACVSAGVDNRPDPYAWPTGVYYSGSSTFIHTVSLHLRVDGADVSTLKIVHTREVSGTFPVVDVDHGDGSASDSYTLEIDGVVLYSGTEVCTIGSITTTALGASVTVAGHSCYCHLVRYSNNAWGLVLTGMDVGDFGHTGYHAGIYNVVLGQLLPPAGWVDPPNDTLLWCYDTFSLSVDPLTGDVASTTGGPVCYV